MRRFVAGLALAGLLIGCGQADMATQAPATEESAAYGGMADMAAGEAAPAPPPPMAQPAPAEPGRGVDVDTEERQQGPGTPGSSPSGPAPVLYLAYAYAMGLEVPSERLAGVMDRHVQACQTAGPRLCQLIGSNRSGDPESYMEGYVQLRGEPQWLRTFMGGMSAEIDAAGGRVISQSTNAEDLTRQMVDTEARLRAQTALRDRLQQLLRERPGRLADLLEVERELARVQSEIDSVQSTLAVMRTRVAMSELSLQYRSAPRSVGSDTFEPLRRALASFLGIIVAGFAAIITIIAGLIPVAIVVVPIVWFALRWRRRRGGRFFNRSPPPPPAAT
ncbi:MAG: hypothetical protein DCF16_16430 [Alphaproteobacteria bacterium]|nr:MAG: hypothetical protein DCF16_16430 [Alphaproteobacteria bacterium]